IAKFDKTFAKVLRMLATVYLEWDVEKYQDKAISAITLANEEYVHPSGICLELKILLKCGVTWNTMSREERLDCPEIGKALLMHIELLLQRGKELLAKQKIENLITGCRNGKQLSSETLDQLHLLLWDKAEKNFEAEKYQESLQWYNYSLNFYSPGQLDKNLGKLQRNRASCYLQLQQMEMANEAIKEAERCDPENIFTQFSIYKIAVLENCEERGAVICYSILCIYNPIEENYHAFFPLKVLSDFYACKRRRPITGLLKEFVLFFFFSTAWNLALECEGYPPLMKDFFVLSYQLSEYCTSDVPGLIGKKTCLLMIAASCLELGRISSDSYEQIFDLANFIRHTVSSKDPTDIIMLLYEFEARAKLNDPKLETVLESVLELPQIEPKALQTIASLAMESPAYFPFLCKKALRIALSLLRKCQDTDIVQCSQCLHSLIQLSLPTGVLEMESQVLEEAWSYYEDTLVPISFQTGSYPEVEILWLLTKAWNTGILLYSINKYTEAEKWCGLGMSFLRHLGSLQESYEAQVRWHFFSLNQSLSRLYASSF
uniref:Protein ZIP4 homolog n=1 Tax=Erpetoichthys calabaricus TaxID=27687 RepID=A0A8C4SSU1_ERPCA